MQLDWLDGEMTDQCGQDRHLANHSPLQGNKTAQVTSDIYGLSGSISSGSADLQSFLENKLARRLHSAGLTNSRLTWSQVTTVAGRSLSQLQVSVPSTKENGFGSWPTACARDYKGSTPGGRIRNGNWSTDTLDAAVQLTQWLTPTTSDMNGVRELDGKRSGGLNTQATFVNRTTAAGWPTPNAGDAKAGMHSHQYSLGTYAGKIASQSTAGTGSTASSQLNPRFSLWLMGYPTEWACCAERVTRSSRKSRQKS